MDNASLESMFHWLSDDIVRLKKCNTVSDVLAWSQQQAVIRGEVITLCCHRGNNYAVGTNI